MKSDVNTTAVVTVSERAGERKGNSRDGGKKADPGASDAFYYGVSIKALGEGTAQNGVGV